MEKYRVAHSTVSQLIEDVRRNNIAIPELQRPFVWKSVKVRDLMDSLYKGYPVGYLITWQSVGAHIRGGETATHQHILIDGQQRVTALRAAIAGMNVVDTRYRRVRITIAFNPVTEEFGTLTPVIRKNPEWISDISTFFNSTSAISFVNDYMKANSEADTAVVEANIERLASIKNAQIGVISLADDLDVETVSEIFIRINSKGVPLSSADFVMSKVASYGERGRNLRKLIDYFCHLSVAAHAYVDIHDNDSEFSGTDYFRAIAWLKNDSEDLYDPAYGDVIRIAGLVGFGRGKASSIVNELSGRDPETRRVDEDRIPAAYDKLEAALLRIVNKYDFENFVMTIKSAGFISPNMINSQNALNFAYALYLRLRADKDCSEGKRKHIVRRWFVMSMLTGRHSGSFESTWERDLRRMDSLGVDTYLKQIEESELTDSFWQAALPRDMETTSINSPYFQTFLAAQAAANTHGFLSKNITVTSMIQQSGDIHHLFPKDFLRKNGFPDRSDYNQVANFALTETAININISNRPPVDYMADIGKQVKTGRLTLGELTDRNAVEQNLKANAVPENFSSLGIADYPDFLARRRKLMAKVIRDYYARL